MLKGSAVLRIFIPNKSGKKKSVNNTDCILTCQTSLAFLKDHGVDKVVDQSKWLTKSARDMKMSLKVGGVSFESG